MRETQDQIIDDISSLPFPFAAADERAVIESLLEAIPAAIEHAQWFRIAGAIKSSLGDAGYMLFDEWSQGAPDKYDPTQSRKTWDGIDTSKGITLGTLVHIGGQHGWIAADSPRVNGSHLAREFARPPSALPTPVSIETLPKPQSASIAFSMLPVSRTDYLFDYRSTESLLDGIQKGEWATLIQEIRVAIGKAQESRKEALPWAAWSVARFGGRSRKAAEVAAHSGFIILDIDDLSFDDLDDFRAQVESLSGCYASFVSPRGGGMKVVYRIDPIPSGGTDSLLLGHDLAYRAVYAHFLAACDLPGRSKLDTAARDISRASFVSYDPDCYIAPDSAPIEWAPLKQDESASTAITERDISLTLSDFGCHSVGMIHRLIRKNKDSLLVVQKPFSGERGQNPQEYDLYWLNEYGHWILSPGRMNAELQGLVDDLKSEIKQAAAEQSAENMRLAGMDLMSENPAERAQVNAARAKLDGIEAEIKAKAGISKKLLGQQGKNDCLYHLSGAIHVMRRDGELPASVRVVHVTALDANPRYFGVANGVIDLDNGELVSGSEAARCLSTVSTILPYEASARHAKVEYLTQGMDEEQRRLFWACIGASIRSIEQRIYMLKGPPGSGKSTIVEMVMHALRTQGAERHAYTLAKSAFALERSPSPNAANDHVGEPFARGRIAHMDEYRRGQIDTDMLVQYFGGSAEITWRKKWGEWITTPVRASVWWTLNEVPVNLFADAAGMPRRVIVISVPAKLFEGDPNPKLRGEIKENDEIGRALLAKIIRETVANPTPPPTNSNMEKAQEEARIESFGEFGEFLVDNFRRDDNEEIMELSTADVFSSAAFHAGVDLDKKERVYGKTVQTAATAIKGVFKYTKSAIKIRLEGGKSKRVWPGLRYVLEEEECEQCDRELAMGLSACSAHQIATR